jgi:hypothetical protein
MDAFSIILPVSFKTCNPINIYKVFDKKAMLAEVACVSVAKRDMLFSFEV